MNKFLQILGLTFCLITQVMGQQPYYNSNEKAWNEDSIQGEIEHTIYLIGDGGEIDSHGLSGVELLQKHLENETKNSSVIFLGDNIYPNGLPAKDDIGRKIAEEKLLAQTDGIQKFAGNVYFIPGNHDWDRWSENGWDAIKREEAFIESTLGKGNTFLPDCGCPGPVELTISKDILLVFIDTQWWLHKWKKPYGEKDSCLIKNEFDFTEKLKEISDKNADKQIIVVGHHPIFSNGNHGGYFTLKDHLFPLTALNKRLFIPLPGLGSIYPLYRKYSSPLQDINNPRYQLFKKELLNAFSGHQNFIYAAGHEHNLQYFEVDNQNFIVSGSGSKEKPVAKKHGASFNVAKQGFSKVIYLTSGETWIEFWVVSEKNPKKGELVFRKRIKDATIKVDHMVEDRPDYNDSTITIAAGEIFNAGKFKRLILGDHHRDVWMTPIPVKVLDLEKEGLRPLKLGGGMQTKSLRLVNSEKEEFVFRSIKKDVTRKFLADDMKETWIADLMKDQVSLSHPYGALVVPKLAKSAGVLHKQTQLVFIPDDPLLGEFREIYKNTLAIYEERASKNLSNYENFDYAEKAISTPDLIEKIHSSHNNVVDESDMLKNRLFDMWLGDFDRHDDQWRWAEFECEKSDHDNCYHVKEEVTGKGHVYRPIPRDRDQVFPKVDGLFASMLSLKFAPGRLLRDFDYEIHDIVGLNINGREIDKTFLTRLTEDQWISIAESLQENLTDSVIYNAFKQLPDTIYKLGGEEIIAKLIKRRSDLVEYAKIYYKILAKEVEVVGSDKDEIFEVYRELNGNTTVKVFKSNKNENELLYARTFKLEETDEILLYGFGGNDVFKLYGNAKKGISVRIIGGEGEDFIKDISSVRGAKRLTRVYDERTGTSIEGGNEIRNLTSDEDKEINNYSRLRFKPNTVAPVIKLGSNIDDGVFVGGGVFIKNHGWRKAPFANTHKISGAIAPKTSAFNLLYDGNFYQLISKWDLHIQTRLLAPANTTNFYGIGNETSTLDINENFYHLSYNYAEVKALMGKKIAKYHRFEIGPKYEYVEILQQNNNFASSVLANLPASAFQKTSFAGLQTNYKISTLNNERLPTKGFSLVLMSDWLYNTSTKTSLSNLQTELVHFKMFNLPFKPLLVNRIGGATIFNDFEFYQSNTLGAQNRVMERGNLRGFHRDRYAGRSVVYHNLDLRLSLFNFRSYLFPGEFGVFGFLDHGRVWADYEKSEVWHRSYGGGLWMSIMHNWAIVTTYEKSKENQFINIHLSFAF